MTVSELSPPRTRTPDGAPGFLRLASCPRCLGRRRALVEVNGRVRGRCLTCGEELNVPLAVEAHRRVELLGQGGGARRTDGGAD